ncbi:MAG: hypothetical protein RLZZ360_536 [Candidatus Parcubacteria bacterium]
MIFAGFYLQITSNIYYQNAEQQRVLERIETKIDMLAIGTLDSDRLLSYADSQARTKEKDAFNVKISTILSVLLLVLGFGIMLAGEHLKNRPYTNKES